MDKGNAIIWRADAEDGGGVWIHANGEWGHDGGALNWALDAMAQELARLKPSGQVAEDVERVRTAVLSDDPPPIVVDEGITALSRLAAKAQGYEAAVGGQGHAIPALSAMQRERDALAADNAALMDALNAAVQGRRFELKMPHPGAALMEQCRKEVETLKAAMTKAAAELRHTYGHVALEQSINPDLVARAIRILEEAGR